MKSDKQGKKKIVDKKWLLLILLLIPFLSIILIITFRHNYMPTNDEIIQYLKDCKAYSSDATYTIINTKGEYKENTKIHYGKDLGMRIEFGQDRVKIYKDGFISMKQGDEEYELKEGFDTLYPLVFPSNLLNYEIKSIDEGEEEWGDIKYLSINIKIPSKNMHMVEAKIYVDKINKTPILTKIYDDSNKERVVIVYDNFNYLKEIDRELFWIKISTSYKKNI